MQRPLQIRSRDFSLNAAVTAVIRAKATKLGKYHHGIIGCRVTVEAPSIHHHTGGPFRVHIDLTVPGTELIADQHTDNDLLVAIRDAFDAIRRQLGDYTRQRRGAVKSHADTPHGRVSKMFVEEGYGFIETPNGREIYFHHNSVPQAGFEKLKVGMVVRFVEKLGDKGPQASTVNLLG